MKVLLIGLAIVLAVLWATADTMASEARGYDLEDDDE